MIKQLCNKEKEQYLIKLLIWLADTSAIPSNEEEGRGDMDREVIESEPQKKAVISFTVILHALSPLIPYGF